MTAEEPPTAPAIHGDGPAPAEDAPLPPSSTEAPGSQDANVSSPENSNSERKPTPDSPTRGEPDCRGGGEGEPIPRAGNPRSERTHHGIGLSPQEEARLREVLASLPSKPHYNGITHYKKTTKYEIHLWHANKQKYLGGSSDPKRAALTYDCAVAFLRLGIRGPDAKVADFPAAQMANMNFALAVAVNELDHMNAWPLSEAEFIDMLRDRNREPRKRVEGRKRRRRGTQQDDTDPDWLADEEEEGDSSSHEPCTCTS